MQVLLNINFVRMNRIIGIGETVLDIIFRDDNPTAAVPGGSTFNAMISLGRTVGKRFPQVPLLMVTETGDDHIGDIVVSFMESNGVSSEAVTRNKGTQSHISLAFLDENNDAHYEFYKDHAHAELCFDKVSQVSFRKGDFVIFGSFFAINPVIRDFVKGLLAKAREAGAVIYYDINFRPSHIKDLPETMENIIENCRLSDFVRGSSEDFQFLFGTSDGPEIYQKHIAPLCKNFILTRGADPVEVYTPGGVWKFPVPAVETVSTIGAGDNFNAGFLYSLLAAGYNGEEMDEQQWKARVETASRFSSAVCQSVYNYVDEGFRPE